ncbi:MAG: hypothetical protein ACLS48_12785 [[Eubacterium] siraeum]
MSGILSHYSIGIFNIGIFSHPAFLCSAMKYGRGAGAVCGAVSALGVVATADYAFLRLLCPAAAVGGMFSGGRKLSAAGGFVLTATLGTALFEWIIQSSPLLPAYLCRRRSLCCYQAYSRAGRYCQS